jgi:hypothetical protein
MRKILLFLASSFISAVCFAAPMVHEQPAHANTQGCVVISTSAWTACPTTPLAGRQNIWFANASSDTYVGTTDNTVAISTGATPLVLPAKTMLNFSLDDAVLTYWRSLGNGPGNVCADELTYR